MAVSVPVFKQKSKGSTLLSFSQFLDPEFENNLFRTSLYLESKLYLSRESEWHCYSSGLYDLDFCCEFFYKGLEGKRKWKVYIISKKCVTLDVLQVKMAAMECAPITRTREMETEIPPHLSTVPVQLAHPMRAHLRNNACPDRNLRPRHLVAAAITTDIVPTVIHTIATSHLLQRRRKCSTKVCLHNYYISNVCSLKWN